MEGSARNEEISHNLLDFILQDKEWRLSREEGRTHKPSENRKLELRLGPPGEEEYSSCIKKNSKSINGEGEKFQLSLGCFSPQEASMTQKSCVSDKPAGGAILSSQWFSSSSGYEGNNNHQQTKASSFLQFPSSPQGRPVIAKQVSRPCSNNGSDLQSPEEKAFFPSSANTAVPSSSQKRTAAAPAPVVGWPPIRSFRKNLASSSHAKAAAESEHQHLVSDKVCGKKPVDDSSKKGLFVKINMDGVPIGRKVDLNAYDSYEKLSSAVDTLFRGLLAAQRDSSAGGIQNKQEEEKAITGILDGSGEYTLVYEDNEGDRMLVGDVPWHMFVSTVKRLRVLKSAEVSSLSLGSKRREETS